MKTTSLAVLLIVDGLRPDALALARTPGFDALRARGAATGRASSLMPTVTLPVHTSIFHSVPATRHGITTNVWTPMARPLPGLADVAHAAGLSCAFLYNWEPLRDLCRPGHLDITYFRRNSEFTDGDQVIADETARYLTGDRPDFMFVYFGGLDNAAHRFGFMSDGYLEHLERVDAALKTLLDALPDDATLLLTSDHGDHDRDHGTDAPEDMLVPWMIAGPGIRRGHEIEADVCLLDVAPTLARVMGITPHADWEGVCVEEVWG